MSTTVAIDKAAYFKKIGYVPHSLAQRAYHSSSARFKIPVCGRRFGKSLMTARDAEPELLLPDRMYWIAGPNYDLGEKEFRVIWNDMIRKLGLGRDKRVKKGYSKKSGNMFIEFPWNTRIEVRSGEHPESLVGEGLHGVILAEAAKHRPDAWEQYIRPALADYRGWATFSSTPEGQNFLYKIWQLGQNPNEPDYESWRFPSWENTIVYPGGYDDPEIQLLKRTMADDIFQQEIAADFTAFVGKIYTEFDEQTHVIDNYQFRPDWPNHIGWDWGYTRPLAAIEFQVSPSDEIFIWREHYLKYTTLMDHFRIMNERPQPEGYHITSTFGDAADPEAVAMVNGYFAPCIAEDEAKANWREGVDLVREFIKDRVPEDIDMTGEIEVTSTPGLMVDRACVNTIWEFNNYRGKNPGTSKAADAMKEGPFKKDDHAMDGIRYALMHIFKLGAQHHLEEVYNDPNQSHIAGRRPQELISVSATDLMSPVAVADAGFFSLNTDMGEEF